MKFSLRFLTLGLGLAIAAALVPQLAHAAIDSDDDMVGYDQIVNDLSKAPDSSSKTKIHSSGEDPFADVMIHGGIGLTSTFGQIRAPGGRPIQMGQSGMQAALGIDLFSHNWFAEGTARTFGNTEYDASRVSLREFDLKVYYKDRITGGLGYRLGLGLAARYLRMEDPINGRKDYTTPASVIIGGVEYYLGRSVSLGAEVSARNAMIADTIDHSSFDGTIRLDTHF